MDLFWKQWTLIVWNHVKYLSIRFCRSMCIHINSESMESFLWVQENFGFCCECGSLRMLALVALAPRNSLHVSQGAKALEFDRLMFEFCPHQSTEDQDPWESSCRKMNRHTRYTLKISGMLAVYGLFIMYKAGPDIYASLGFSGSQGTWKFKKRRVHPQIDLLGNPRVQDDFLFPKICEGSFKPFNICYDMLYVIRLRTSLTSCNTVELPI